MKLKGTRSLSACIHCRKAKIKCTNFDSKLGCDECGKRQLKCIMDPCRKKRGPKPKTIHVMPTSQLPNTINFDSREKKLCKGGTPGLYKCDRCQKKSVCIFQCTACYKKNKDKKDQLPQCNHCKVISGDPPPESILSKYNITMDETGQKSYLHHYNCNHKLEITADAMISSYKTINPTYIAPDDVSELSNLHGQNEESDFSEIDLTSTIVMNAYDPQFVYDNTYYPVINTYENIDQYYQTESSIPTHFNTFTNSLSLPIAN
ncbi:15630_t:CDS:2 [Dentiscutata heterogama]|uniref:15630_t:CDS:1 n=1 Tax=Dentiscutata heterogama TaxID=1316150 RepID=A0ACA9NM35_9GLOM|nr:15630_t:CDS:2 [Dentiscutata heterogama]